MSRDPQQFSILSLITVVFYRVLTDSLSAVLPTPARNPQAGYVCSRGAENPLTAAGGASCEPAQREPKAHGQRWSRRIPLLGLQQAEVACSGAPFTSTPPGEQGPVPCPHHDESLERSPARRSENLQRAVRPPSPPGPRAACLPRPVRGCARASLGLRLPSSRGAHRASGPLDPLGRRQ